MPTYFFIWDDSEGGNVDHLAEHGVTPQEAESVMEQPESHDFSQSSGLPIAFGFTMTGRYLMLVYEMLTADTIYVHTGYEVPRRNPRR
ncbi:MAG: hypothetical protein IT445_15710 [Phycisphaeraceae bacterium]|nr:hypothetical protein [Phycisphaeraceae bacterium]